MIAHEKQVKNTLSPNRYIHEKSTELGSKWTFHHCFTILSHVRQGKFFVLAKFDQIGVW